MYSAATRSFSAKLISHFVEQFLSRHNTPKNISIALRDAWYILSSNGASVLEAELIVPKDPDFAVWLAVKASAGLTSWDAVPLLVTRAHICAYYTPSDRCTNFG